MSFCSRLAIMNRTSEEDGEFMHLPSFTPEYRLRHIYLVLGLVWDGYSSVIGAEQSLAVL